MSIIVHRQSFAVPSRAEGSWSATHHSASSAQNWTVNGSRSEPWLGCWTETCHRRLILSKLHRHETASIEQQRQSLTSACSALPTLAGHDRSRAPRSSRRLLCSYGQTEELLHQQLCTDRHLQTSLCTRAVAILFNRSVLEQCVSVGCTTPSASVHGCLPK